MTTRLLLTLLGLLLCLTNVGQAELVVGKIVATGLDRPVYVTSAPGQDNTIYVVEQNTAAGTGRVQAVDIATGVKTQFLEVTSPVPYFQFSESGIHGMAFHPDYQTNHLFYISRMWYDGVRLTNRLEEYVDTQGGPALTRVMFDIDNLSQARGHGINWIGFDPTATGAARNELYVTWGDGGFQADEVGFTNVSQDLSVVYGKVLKIDVAGADAYPNDPLKNFAIPNSNPFANDGNPNTLGEVLHSGLRNPWRASFDVANGNMMLSDSGHQKFEEVNLVKAGEKGLDFGWSNREGTVQSNYPYAGGPLGNSVDPLFQYGRINGVANVGGYVYRGPDPTLQGKYIFSEYFGRVYAFDFDPNTPLDQFNGNNVTGFMELTQELQASLGRPLGILVSMGTDNRGNLYGVSQGPVGFTDGSGFIYLISAVPEPSSMILVGAVAMIAVACGWRQRKHVLNAKDSQVNA